MNEQLSLSTTLRQQQRLTPQQLQFVRMLEMNAPEMEEAVRNALDEMPALEATETDDNPIPTYNYKYYSTPAARDDHYDPVTGASNGEETMIESLERQLSERSLSPTEKLIAANIVGNLDSNGYMTRNLQSIADDIATRHSIPVTIDEVYDVWQTVRSLDPAGIAAADLRDCLLLQLRRMKTSPAVATATEIVADYFDLYSKKHYQRLKTSIGIDNEQLNEADTLIKRLNPKPGSSFPEGSATGEGTSQPVTPDFAVEVDGDNLILSSLTRIPELSIEKTFANEADFDTSNERQMTATLFVRRKRDEAKQFIRLVTMRRDTLWKVMQAILKIQRPYFLTGDQSLIKPMILRDIATLTGLNLSVISRATSGKYVATPYGIISLKSLFNERPKDDMDVSSHQLLAALRSVIETEDPAHPLSDQALTEILQHQGFDIARRTIAKYRERLGIPVARLRKKL